MLVSLLPPIPREHGAWFMMYVPLLIPTIAYGPQSGGAVFLLAMAITSLFFGQSLLRLTIRRRRISLLNGVWLGVCCILCLAGFASLILVHGFRDLLVIAAIGSVLCAGYAGLWLVRTRRLDRSVWGEILAAVTLSLSAPAACVIAQGKLEASAMIIWGMCAVYFASGVLYVNMLIQAGKSRDPLQTAQKWLTGCPVLVYHSSLLIGAIALVTSISVWAVWLVCLAYAPVIIRAFWGWVTLSNVTPTLSRVGAMEAIYALWFLVFLAAAVKTVLPTIL